MRHDASMILRAILCAFCAALLFAIPAAPGLAGASQPGIPYKVGIRQIELRDTQDGDRPLAVTLFYPAVARGKPAVPFKMPFYVNLDLDKDAEPAPA
jgi:hypothetical protein